MVKQLLLIIIVAWCVAPPLLAQTAATPTKGASETAATSAQLAEALQLTISAVKLHNEGKSKEALPLAERALKLREEALGAEHQLVAESLVNLGAVQSATGKPDKVRSLYNRALAIYEKGGGANNVKLIRLHDALGVLERFAFANYAAAIEHYESTLALREKAPGTEPDDVIKNLYTLAELYALRGQNEQALAMHRRVVKIREKEEAKESSSLASALERLSCVSERLGREEEAKDAERRAAQIWAREEERREREKAEGKNSISGGQLVQGGVINGKAISKPQPVYPEAAKQQRITGTVIIYVTVDEAGRVIQASSCGHPLLAEASLRAAYGARFSPTLLSGMPVKVNGIITYRFILQ
ncbi:MAG TPA: TonB family protein [Pyrinomonadaceae bacterium]|nr:TonB family protein [Pyrinomonadaceae bacterium]